MAEKTFKLTVAAPDRLFYEGDAVMVELNTTEGEIGVYKDHIPMTMILAPGVLTITEPKGSKKADLFSGFLEIQKEKITILAEAVEWREQ